jgi:DNA invertase Pin-like site-specific DNA recombinase
VVNGLALEAGDVVVVSKLDRLGRSAAIRRALVCVFNRIGKN